MKNEIERRCISLQELRMDPGTGDEKPRIVGHAAVFHAMSEDLGGFREKIAPGAFTESIANDDIRALFNHKTDFVLGRNRAGTLDLHEDEKGLAISIDPPDTSFARDLAVSMERGDISQMSFGFITIEDSWEGLDSSNPVRTLNKVRLLDISPVTYPAYPQTEVALRSMEKNRPAALPAGETLGILKRKQALIESL